MRSVRYVVPLLLALSLLACHRRPALVTGGLTETGEVISFAPMPVTIVFPSAALDVVQASLARALEARSYVLETSEPGRLVARMSARRVTVRIAIDYDQTSAVVTYLGGEGLRIESASSSRRYDGWIEELRDTVVADLGQSSFAPPPVTVVYGRTDIDAVRAALGRALEVRDYTLESSEGSRIVAHWAGGSQSVRVSIEISETQAVISYLASTGMPVESPSSSRRFDGWMNDLSATITDEIGRPERERLEREQWAAAAASRERVERDRLATDRARAEASAADARAREAEAIAHPRVEIGVVSTAPRLEFDGDRARRGRGAVRLRAGFGETTERSRERAGGPVTAADLGLPSSCAGWFPTEAQETIVIDGDLPYFRIEAPSDGDATLLVVTPDGSVWCDDDAAGNLTPRLAGYFPGGVYHVFVGSYAAGTSLRFSLTMSEYGPPSASTSAPVATVVTEQCTNIRAMMWLARLSGRGAGREWDQMAERERVACDAGIEAASTEVWGGSGITLRSGDTWYYPSGVAYFSGGSVYYPTGVAFLSGGTYYYPNGVVMRSGGTWYASNGVASSESALLGAAMGGLARDRYEHLMGLYRSASNEYWSMTYLLSMVVESSR